MVTARFEGLDGLSDESLAGLINECGHAASEQGALSLPSSMRLFFAAVRDLLLAERKRREFGLRIAAPTSKDAPGSSHRPRGREVRIVRPAVRKFLGPVVDAHSSSSGQVIASTCQICGKMVRPWQWIWFAMSEMLRS